MNLTITSEITDQVYGPLELSGDMALQDLVALIQLDAGFDDKKHELHHNMKALRTDDTKTLEELGISDNDLLVIKSKTPTDAPATTNDSDFIEQFRQQLINNPQMRAQFVAQSPLLDQVIEDPAQFFQVMGPYLLQGRQQQNPFGIPQAEYDRLMSSPDDPANQRRISELINQQEIDEQMRNALEFTPEVFTPVHMLYINLEINGNPVKAFVDSGAQATIMSTKLAEKTGLTRLIDKRFQGQARGVGTSQIVGKIHTAQVKIETQFIPCSFTVLDTHVDMLLGLDMLKRHQACVDLKDNVLRIAGVETKFLSEAEIPKDLEEEQQAAAAAASSTGVIAAQNPLPPLPAATPTTQPATRSYPESTVTQLMGLGFSKQQVIRALDQTNGNAEYAAALLFQ